MSTTMDKFLGRGKDRGGEATEHWNASAQYHPSVSWRKVPKNEIRLNGINLLSLLLTMFAAISWGLLIVGFVFASQQKWSSSFISLTLFTIVSLIINLLCNWKNRSYKNKVSREKKTKHLKNSDIWFIPTILDYII